ncbi:DNA repair protein RAD51 homolog 2 isoform X1 [Ipomoea triloba]|uniref:DNA repair protein RAD51 homolog 2 isoform X1 n=1 Tax=Ipomoea triloba TaxID=35885 RepID=UPI00125D5F9A|nr:DNA repair protein RAD51 homolog 2 isoform X1 [Ipomoea triloba]XP_031121774.1 DNA repair protein RAD51 homolog 2 isoform X1 [Ipomoea triloba]
MANKLISQMGLPKSVSNVFAARNIITAKDALSLTEFELMELLDLNLSEVISAVGHISEIASPPYQTALSLLELRVNKENFAGHLPTRLKGLDAALCGGIPFGVVTELVGPAGIGKTQFCLKLSLLAALPSAYGGLDGHVLFIDTESKFSSKRMIEIGVNSFPEVFHKENMAQEMAGRIIVLRPTSLSEFTERLQQIRDSLFQHNVKLLIVDSLAALLSGESSQGPHRQHSLGWHISFLKSLAEFSRIPVVVTNQVRSQNRDEISQYFFQAQRITNNLDNPTKFDHHLIAALGIHWSHAVTNRLVFESRSGQRFMKVAKSSISPPIAFPFDITSSGISLLDDDGEEITGPEINTINYQGHSCLNV